MNVYVDVDDTLVRWAGSKCIPRTLVVEKLKERAKDGDTLYLWSRAGADLAREVAVELGVEDLFVAILPKPDVYIDDEPFDKWRQCQHEYP